MLNWCEGITSQISMWMLFDCNTYIQLYFHAIFCSFWLTTPCTKRSLNFSHDSHNSTRKKKKKTVSLSLNMIILTDNCFNFFLITLTFLLETLKRLLCYRYNSYTTLLCCDYLTNISLNIVCLQLTHSILFSCNFFA